jgi:hypothetical protein
MVLYNSVITLSTLSISHFGSFLTPLGQAETIAARNVHSLRQHQVCGFQEGTNEIYRQKVFKILTSRKSLVSPTKPVLAIHDSLGHYQQYCSTPEKQNKPPSRHRSSIGDLLALVVLAFDSIPHVTEDTPQDATAGSLNGVYFLLSCRCAVVSRHVDDVLVQFPQILVGQNFSWYGRHFTMFSVLQPWIADLVHEFLKSRELRGISEWQFGIRHAPPLGVARRAIDLEDPARLTERAGDVRCPPSIDQFTPVVPEGRHHQEAQHVDGYEENA